MLQRMTLKVSALAPSVCVCVCVCVYVCVRQMPIAPPRGWFSTKSVHAFGSSVGIVFVHVRACVCVPLCTKN